MGEMKKKNSFIGMQDKYKSWDFDQHIMPWLSRIDGAQYV